MDKLISDKYSEFVADCGAMLGDHLPLIDSSFEIANSKLWGLLRENGDPFIFHAIEIARIIVLDLGLSAISVAALFLHEAHAKSSEEIDLSGFNPDILRIVDGLNKISHIDIKATSLQAENFRKLIVSYSSDPRVTLIKLADRLEVMRSLSFFSPLKQMQKSAETMLLYAPLAHQLGLYHLKAELENLAFKFSDALSFRLVSNKLKATNVEREHFISEFVKPIEVELKKHNFKYEIKSRTKSPYSIWRKMKAKQVDFENVYDVFAIRIIIDTDIENEKAACFEIYSLIENIYKPDVRRFRDWISHSKSTGYESLHTTVQTNEGRFVEVQIRTTRMDDIAEKGTAAHWKYKGIKQEQTMQAWLNNARILLEESKIESADKFEHYEGSEVFVFTPNGDLRRLQAGATVLDFAFDIHTNIGSRCVGALVNGKNTTIRECLKTGDVVEIKTSKNQVPKTDWLSFVVSSKAKSRIRAKLREEEKKAAVQGREMLERRLKNWKLSTLDEVVTVLTKYYKQKNATNLYALIGNEKISLSELRDVLRREYGDDVSEKTTETPIPKVVAPKATLKESHSDYLIINENVKGLTYSFAKCCNPIKGCDIFGFVTINSGIRIHRITCPNAARLLDRYPYRIVKAKWNELAQGLFLATIGVKGDNEIGIINNIAEVLKKFNVEMRSINVSSQSSGFDGKIEVAVPNAKVLEGMIHALHKIRGIDKVMQIK